MRNFSTQTQTSALVLLAADDAQAAATPAAKVKTVKSDMDRRRIFATTEDAANYLNACASNFDDFAETPMAFAGMTPEGDFDPEIYTDQTEVMVGVLMNDSKVKCVFIVPCPTLAAIMADDAGTAWAQKILHKELAHVAVRQLRIAEDISTVVDQMPTTRDAFISSAREGGGGILEAFNELYKPVSATMAKNSQVWAKFKLNKPELRKALESKAYASEYYAALENRGDKPSLFVMALQLAKAAAAKQGLDPTIFQRWEETRDQKALTAVTEDEEESFDVDALAAAMETAE